MNDFFSFIITKHPLKKSVRGSVSTLIKSYVMLITQVFSYRDIKKTLLFLLLNQ